MKLIEGEKKLKPSFKRRTTSPARYGRAVRSACSPYVPASSLAALGDSVGRELQPVRARKQLHCLLHGNALTG